MIETVTETIGQALVRQQHGLIDFDVEALTKRVFVGWLDFLTEPDDYRKLWTFGAWNDPDEGYIFRGGKPRGESQGGGAYDDKHFFHYVPHLWPLLKWQGVDYARHERWLMDCHELYSRCLEKATEVYGSIDEAIPGLGFSGRIRDPRAAWKTRLRLLAYKQAQSEGEELGKFHIDRAFMTLHVAENFPGLNLDFGDGALVPYSVKPGKILVFPGGKADDATGNQIRGLRHGVIAPPGVPVGAERQSIVFFAHI